MKKDFKVRLQIIIGILIIFLGVIVNKVDINVPNNGLSPLRTAESWNLTGTPILIDDLNPTRNWAFTVSNYDWCSGAGTLANPYIIENVTIDGQYSGSCIEIRNSNAYFILRNCTLYNSWFINFFDDSAGIKLDHVNNGILVNNNCSFNRFHGIYLFYSDHNTVSGNILNDNYNGVYLSWSENNYVSENLIEDSIEYGIYLEWSDWIMLSENNMTNCGIGIKGGDYYITNNDIATSNLVNQKPVYYYINTNGLGPYNFTNAGQIILLSCENSLIENLNVSNGSCGIALHYSNNNIIRYVNSSYNTDRGIYLWYSVGNSIHDNRVDNNGHGTLYNDRGGIVLSLSSFNDISSNLVNYNSKGISMQNGKNNTLINNTANYNTKCGIHINSANTSLYMNRMLYCGVEVQNHASTDIIPISNEVNGKPIYFYKDTNYLHPDDFNNAGQVILVNCNNSLISDLDLCLGSCGITLINSNYNVISSNNASYNTINGIFIDYVSYHNNVTNNNFIDNLEEGMEIHGDSNLISQNNVSWNELNLDSHCGILIWGKSNLITKNEISRNNRYGIALVGDSNTVSENNIFENYLFGIDLGADYTQIKKNNIFNNKDSGIRIHNSDNNNFTDNLLENNTIYGILIFDNLSVNNYLFHNLFIHNGIQASDNSNPHTNFWDNGIIGNYWDDYLGIDANEDGIGDVPYNITGTAGNQDNFPIWDKKFEVLKIYIDDLASGVGAQNWTWAADQWWCYGAGTLNNPYLIENLIIDGRGFRNCLEIRNSNVYFVIRNCTFINSGNGNAGIKLWYTSNGEIFNNTCFSNYHGISLDQYTNNNTISSNRVFDNNQDGIRISSYFEQHSENNIILSNNISNNMGIGIFFDQYSHYNVVYLNRLIDNGVQAQDDGANNDWEYATTGNYWNDYTGKDVNDDSFGDTPYIIQGIAGSLDIYPIWWDSPLFSITSPINNTTFELDSPDFSIIIIEGFPFTMWYSLNNESTQYFFTSTTGKINQSAWSNVSYGIVKISFFIEDSQGYISIKVVSIQKQVPSNKVISGFNPIFLVYSLISLITLTIILKLKNKLKVRI